MLLRLEAGRGIRSGALMRWRLIMLLEPLFVSFTYSALHCAAYQKCVQGAQRVNRVKDAYVHAHP